MAEENEKEDKKAAKAAAKEAKKAAKEAKKAAKKGNSDDGDDDDESGGGFVTFLVGLIILVVWLAIFALLIKMDVGHFGSTVLYPILKDVPYVNQILPEVEGADEDDDGYNYATVDEAVERIKELEKELEEAKSNTDSNSAYIKELEAQAEELAEYKQKEADFEATREKFYEEVVFSDEAPDISEYKTYYESIDPESAATIYKSVVEQTQEDEDLEDYVEAYSAMKPKQAAAIFDTMTDDLMLVGKILWAMDADTRGDILGNMDTETAAAVTKLMEP